MPLVPILQNEVDRWIPAIVWILVESVAHTDSLSPEVRPDPKQMDKILRWVASKQSLY
jgi:hypothetical protein